MKFTDKVFGEKEKKWAIYGAGNKGRKYFVEFKILELQIVAWVDRNYQEKGIWYRYEIQNPKVLTNDLDYILVAVEAETIKDEIYTSLEKQGIKTEKLVWIGELEQHQNPEQILIQGCLESPFVRRLLEDPIVRRKLKNKEDYYNEFIGEIEKYVLSKNWKKQYSSWFLDSNEMVAYFRNAKVACTSFRKVVTGISKESPLTIDYKEVEMIGLLPNPEKYFKFTFVRNPFSRLVSCYINLWREPKKPLTHLYELYWMGYLPRDEKFEVWAEKVCSIPDVWSNEHFMSQYYQLYEDGICKCDYVGKMEELPEAFEEIRVKYGLKELPRMNVSSKYNWMDYYDMELAEKVYHRYKKDFEVFGYEEEYKKLKSYIKSKM